jgi:hypothetical protein
LLEEGRGGGVRRRRVISEKGRRGLQGRMERKSKEKFMEGRSGRENKLRE